MNHSALAHTVKKTSATDPTKVDTGVQSPHQKSPATLTIKKASTAFAKNVLS